MAKSEKKLEKKYKYSILLKWILKTLDFMKLKIISLEDKIKNIYPIITSQIYYLEERIDPVFVIVDMPSDLCFGFANHVHIR